MTDRKPTYPNRVKVTREDGSQETLTWEYADNPITQGTPLSKANLLDDDTAQAIVPGVEDPTVNQALAALNRKAETLRSVTVTLPASGWQGSEAPYTQTVTVEGMTQEWIPGQPGAVPQEGQSLEDKTLVQEALSCISEIQSGQGTLTVVCYGEKPEKDLTLRIPGVM